MKCCQSWIWLNRIYRKVNGQYCKGDFDLWCVWREIANRGWAARSYLLSGVPIITYPEVNVQSWYTSFSVLRHRRRYMGLRALTVGDLFWRGKTFWFGEEIIQHCRLSFLFQWSHSIILDLQGMYEYKMYGSFSDVTAEEFLFVQNDLTKFRLSWDNRYHILFEAS